MSNRTTSGDDTIPTAVEDVNDILVDIHANWKTPAHAGGFTTREFDCPRCGGVHGDLPAFAFMLPIKIDTATGYTEYSHWCLCPDRGNPILLRNKETGLL